MKNDTNALVVPNLLENRCSPSVCKMLLFDYKVTKSTAYLHVFGRLFFVRYTFGKRWNHRVSLPTSSLFVARIFISKALAIVPAVYDATIDESLLGNGSLHDNVIAMCIDTDIHVVHQSILHRHVKHPF